MRNNLDRSSGSTASLAAGADSAESAAATGTIARLRWLMMISAATTLLAIAAVVGVIGYRVYRTGDSAAAAMTDGTVFLPKGARVVSATVSGREIVLTLDIAGASEVRIYDRKTLRQTGRLRLAPEP